MGNSALMSKDSFYDNAKREGEKEKEDEKTDNASLSRRSSSATPEPPKEDLLSEDQYLQSIREFNEQVALITREKLKRESQLPNPDSSRELTPVPESMFLNIPP